MRYLFIIFLSVLSLTLQAQRPTSPVTLTDVYNELERVSPYQAKIEVVYGESSILGYYQVDKDNYYISIDEQELFGNSSEKFEVYNSRKEVVIDKVTPEYNGNILNNPATAFSSILAHYSATVISNSDGVTRLELKQNGGDEVIELEVYNSTLLPKSILYKFGDDEIVINIYSITRLTSTIKLYKLGNYNDYEIIDFR